MSYKIEKSCGEDERNNFIVIYNHNQGLRIVETDMYIYALEPWEDVNENNEVMSNINAYEIKQKQEEAERISKLYLTAADIERAIYQAKGMDFDDILAFVENVQKSSLNSEGDEIGCGAIDLKALKIELKANHFYRGNPFVNVVGELLGFTSKQLDEFFETNDYKKLLGVVVSD